MEYKKINGIEKEVSRIVFGSTSIEEYDEETDKLLNDIVQLGVNCIDTARVYGGGKTEYALGEWLEKNNKRDEVIILTKGAHPDMPSWRNRVNKEDITYDIKTSLEALRTDYVDIYLLHRDDPSVPVGEVLEIMQELKESNMVKVLGVSNWTMDRIIEANEYALKHGLAGFEVSSPHFGLAEQYVDLWNMGVTITGDANQKSRDWYEQTQLPVFAYSSLGGGMFSGKIKSDEIDKVSEVMGDNYVRAYAVGENINRLKRCEILAEQKKATVSQIALAWLLRQNLNTFAIASARSINRFEENVKAVDVQLSVEECEFLLGTKGHS